ncbi:MAG: DNA polymerase III subunit delta [Notoacmeibacter sp.]|nr:DNA polymerase III subunit delta [Notoacmeibacter sp.]MCC0033510.1 DNA polymerase III subunit delta [Brucellaceae bacterium]
MAQKKAHEVDGWIARPDKAARIILVYGPDRGMVSERARKIAVSTGLPLDDPFSVIRLEASELDADPGKLIDEARMVPMFSDTRLIWITNGGSQKALADGVKILCDEPPADALLLIEAGDLKKGTTGLRGIVEGASSAMALPCYADDARKIDDLINAELAAHNQTITLDARELLKAGLGGDRLATRGEIEKLGLYAMGKPQITVGDVAESLGDVAASSADDAVDAVLTGDLSKMDLAFSRLVTAGTHPFVVLSTTMRQFSTLQAMRDSMDRERKSAAAAVAAARPPVFFARRKAVEVGLQAWSAPAIARALDRIQDTVLQTRRSPELAEALSRQTLLALAVETARNLKR